MSGERKYEPGWRIVYGKPQWLSGMECALYDGTMSGSTALAAAHHVGMKKEMTARRETEAVTRRLETEERTEEANWRDRKAAELAALAAENEAAFQAWRVARAQPKPPPRPEPRDVRFDFL
jgi:hypothetical protein